MSYSYFSLEDDSSDAPVVDADVTAMPELTDAPEAQEAAGELAEISQIQDDRADVTTGLIEETLPNLGAVAEQGGFASPEAAVAMESALSHSLVRLGYRRDKGAKTSLSFAKDAVANKSHFSLESYQAKKRNYALEAWADVKEKVKKAVDWLVSMLKKGLEVVKRFFAHLFNWAEKYAYRLDQIAEAAGKVKEAKTGEVESDSFFRGLRMGNKIDVEALVSYCSSASDTTGKLPLVLGGLGAFNGAIEAVGAGENFIQAMGQAITSAKAFASPTEKGAKVYDDAKSTVDGFLKDDASKLEGVSKTVKEKYDAALAGLGLKEASTSPKYKDEDGIKWVQSVLFPGDKRAYASSPTSMDLAKLKETAAKVRAVIDLDKDFKQDAKAEKVSVLTPDQIKQIATGLSTSLRSLDKTKDIKKRAEQAVENISKSAQALVSKMASKEVSDKALTLVNLGVQVARYATGIVTGLMSQARSHQITIAQAAAAYCQASLKVHGGGEAAKDEKKKEEPKK